jgi:hypothetical protein
MYRKRVDLNHSVHGRLLDAFRRSDDVHAAIAIGSAAAGAGDQYSDLDYFMYATEPNWPRARMVAWLHSFGLDPTLCYWSGVEKYHMVVDGVGVDLSVRAASQLNEVRTWPSLHFPEQGILKDVDGVLKSMLRERNERKGQLTTDLQNTLHGCLYHAQACAIQLKRGELVNARSRFSGVIESFICFDEQTVVGEMRWREPSRRLEVRMDEHRIARIRELAYCGSPEMLRLAVLYVLDSCERRGELSQVDHRSIENIRSLLGETPPRGAVE